MGNVRISGGQVSCRHLFPLNILLEYRALAFASRIPRYNRRDAQNFSLSNAGLQQDMNGKICPVK